MGEAKRRKQLDPNFGSKANNQLEVQLDPHLVLPKGLNQLKQSLSKEGKTFFSGTVTLNGCGYPAVFIPYTQMHQGKLKLYSHIAFSPENQPETTQTLTNEISQAVCRQILDNTPISLINSAQP